jgi:hypothetical protein
VLVLLLSLQNLLSLKAIIRSLLIRFAFSTEFTFGCTFSLEIFLERLCLLDFEFEKFDVTTVILLCLRLLVRNFEHLI